jgi:hypothetical protein
MTSNAMLRTNRSAPDAAVIPVLYYADVPAAVAWLTTNLPFTERLRNAVDRRQLVHGNGAIVVTIPGAHAEPRLRHCRVPERTPSRFVSRASTQSLNAPRQPGLAFSPNQPITCMASANARFLTRGDIRGRCRRRSSTPTQATGAANF